MNTETGIEEGRYKTCPEAMCDPSRTSVNLYGDMVVTNRYYNTAQSSVTKFAGHRKDCIDRNENGTIETSTGGTNVLPWGQDECMLWHVKLPNIGTEHARARATAWDGSEDPKTGAGGTVIIGSCVGDWDQTEVNRLYYLDGGTGAVTGGPTIPDTQCFYGGAMDNEIGRAHV